MANIIHHAKLGDLCYMKSPQSIHCWHGTITGCEQGFDIILASSNLDVTDVDFIADIIQNWKYHEEKALEHIRVKLATQLKCTPKVGQKKFNFRRCIFNVQIHRGIEKANSA